ncbi:helix-turn-helix transcriptional regulator [Arthrobacter crystallopoietes]|uniref:helix-turn-helix transcriptional regulator n=1 Tax=Crystallibacter crystallopoietes TaxID=37928 RepID=UPI001ABEC48A|nr:AAA family ATPase [Arthrobacter crystallopoietes]QTG79427.1 AAA family ATPase [Arthrobacter crystallopoietes]
MRGRVLGAATVHPGARIPREPDQAGHVPELAGLAVGTVSPIGLTNDGGNPVSAVGLAAPANVFVGRQREIEEVRSALQDNLRVGAMLVGEPGVGKTALAMEALKTFYGNHHIVPVRGSAISAKVPYAALGYLLSELPEHVLDHPVLAMQGLSRLLTEQADGRTPVLLVENAHELDPMSVMAVTQMAVSGQAKLLILARELTGAAEEFIRLWADGHVRRIDLAPFTMEESAGYLEALLGGRVVRTAVATLHSHTSGSPGFLRMLASEQRHAGTLVEQDGSWDLVAPLVRSGEIAEVIRARLDRYRPEQRRIIELLAFAVELPLEALQRLAAPEDLDVLEEHGVMRVLATSPPIARLQNQLSAETVRETVPPGRSRELREAVAATIDFNAIPGGTLMGFASWSIDCGVELPPEAALRAAQLANRLYDHAGALRFVRSVPDHRKRPEMVLQEANALRSLGELNAAAEALESVLEAARGNLRLWTLLCVERHRVLRRLPGRAAEAHAVIEQLKAVIGRDCQAEQGGTTNNDGGPPLRWEAVLIESEYATFEGRHAQLPRELEDIYGDETLPLGMRLYAGCLLAEGWSLTGRSEDALAVVAWLETGTADPDLSPALRDTVLVRVFEIYFNCGLWHRAADLLSPRRGASLVSLARSSGTGTGGELAAGLLHASSGLPDEALDHLLPALAKLRHRDPAGAKPAALAAAAYCSALQAETARARSYLDELAAIGEQPPWNIGVVAAYFRLTAQALLGGRDAALAELKRLAQEAAGRGLVAHSALFLTAAARLGDREAAVIILDRIPETAGQLARTGRLFAAGMLNNDGAALLQAAQLARGNGNELLAYEAASAAHAAAPDPLTARQARELANTSYRRLRRHHDLHRSFETLSRFEQELTVAAARGRSSVELGEQMNLSPRTVDWHLGKIYSKLHVSSRTELAELLI